MSESPNVWKSPAIAMIAAERARQIGELGYSLAHDAGHDAGELALAAAWYAITPRLRSGWSEPTRRGVVVVNIGEILKPDGWVLRGNTDRIRELTKAGALIVAEIERLTLATPAVRACRVCGCTDDRACPGGCSWVAADLCSRCETSPAPEAA